MSAIYKGASDLARSAHITVAASLNVLEENALKILIKNHFCKGDYLLAGTNRRVLVMTTQNKLDISKFDICFICREVS